MKIIKETIMTILLFIIALLFFSVTFIYMVCDKIAEKLFDLAQKLKSVKDEEIIW